MSSLPSPPVSWRKPGFLISTDRSLLSLEAINEAFATDQIYWAKPLEPSVLGFALDNSLNLGLYITTTSDGDGNFGDSEPVIERQIGLARYITDNVTIAFLTDVYVLEEFQGLGLGKWLLTCANEVMESKPALRRTLVLTKLGRHEKFYEDVMGMERLNLEKGGSCCMSRTGPANLL